MNILYVGDVMGEMGMQVIEKVLPKLRKEKNIDLIIAQAENVTDGKGITPEDFRRLKKSGVDFCTGGNHSLDKESIFPLYKDPNQPIIRPANWSDDTPGLGWKYVKAKNDKILVVSLMGETFGKHDPPITNALQAIDRILDEAQYKDCAATVVNLHGDLSSEKVIIGHYLDGRASLVVGDHWHVPTADARILPKGTAHITDVGMCGALDSSLGVSYSAVVSRWRDGKITRNVLEDKGARQFNAVLVAVNKEGLSDKIEQIQKVF